MVRPYDSEEEFLAAEAWTMDTKGMLLIDQPVLPTGTMVRFDITLNNGSKVIRAEGKVVGVAAAKGGRPGGLKVRFKRFGGATKTLIDRVVAERKNGKKPRRPPPRRPPAASAPDVEASAKPESIPPVRSRARSSTHGRPGPVAAPPNREELLERLRARARAKASS